MVLDYSELQIHNLTHTFFWSLQIKPEVKVVMTSLLRHMHRAGWWKLYCRLLFERDPLPKPRFSNCGSRPRLGSHNIILRSRNIATVQS